MDAVDPFDDHPLADPDEIFSHARDFESLVAKFYRRHGCDVQDIGGEGERGADLIVSIRDKRIAIQVKCNARDIGVSAVRQTKRGRTYYETDEAVLVCLGRAGWQAKELAQTECVKIIEGNSLFGKLNDTEKLEFRRIEQLAKDRRALIAAARVPKRRR